MKYVGIDFGSKKTGIAVSDISGSLSFPKAIILTKDLESFLNTLITSEKIEGFVIGYSTNQKGEENKIAVSAQAFGDALSETYPIPVYYEKEFFTSVFARQMQHGKENLNARKIKQKEVENVDAHAAAMMLQRFLDKQKRI